jgi:anti-anti-sigma factor
MTFYQLRTRVRQQPGVAIIDLVGDIDGSAEHVLTDAYDRAEREDPAAILLNFAGVNYINSKGIALIVVLLRRAIQSGQRLSACALSDHYQEIFQITRLADYVAVCTDEETALAKIEASGGILALRRAPGQDSLDLRKKEKTDVYVQAIKSQGANPQSRRGKLHPGR